MRGKLQNTLSQLYHRIYICHLRRVVINSLRGKRSKGKRKRIPGAWEAGKACEEGGKGTFFPTRWMQKSWLAEAGSCDWSVIRTCQSPALIPSSDWLKLTSRYLSELIDLSAESLDTLRVKREEILSCCLACVLVICYLTSIINDQIIEDEVIYNP